MEESLEYNRDFLKEAYDDFPLPLPLRTITPLELPRSKVPKEISIIAEVPKAESLPAPVIKKVIRKRQTLHNALISNLLSESPLPMNRLEIYCTCKYQSEAFKHFKRCLDSSIAPIPILHSSQSSLEESKIVYIKQRSPDFKDYVSKLLDPNLPVYNHGEITNVGVCIQHRKVLSNRLQIKNRAQKYTEFTFSSEFESGNLDRAEHIKDNKFNLYLSFDTNTKGHTQWFYFSVSNIAVQTEIELNIVNFTKNGSLFSKGMRPVVFSEKDSKGWHRAGYDISYTRNTHDRYFTLSFKYIFLHAHDTVYFAYSLPYGYSQLRKFIEGLRRENRKFEEEELCKSLGGLTVPLIRIKEKANLPLVVITARVHPGETVASFMASGLLNFLTGNSKPAEIVRRYCEFIVIPMLNPDGVLMGNYRTSLAGIDLNRQWISKNNDLCPTVEHCKLLSRGAVAYIDLHGHSKKEYCFMYGNLHYRRDEKYWKNRIIPLILSRLTTSFSYRSTRFMQQDFHSTCSRAFAGGEMKIQHAFTLEASFYGYSCKEFDANDYAEVGSKLPIAVLAAVYLQKATVSSRESLYSHLQSFLDKLFHNKEKVQRNRRVFRSFTLTKPPPSHAKKKSEGADLKVEFNDSDSDVDRNSSGSDSNPSDDNLDEEELISLFNTIRDSCSASSQTPTFSIVTKIGRKLPPVDHNRIAVRSGVSGSYHSSVPKQREFSSFENDLHLRDKYRAAPMRKIDFIRTSTPSTRNNNA